MEKTYGVILREKSLDDGLTLEDVTMMIKKLHGIEGIPVEFQGEGSVAMGFINLTDAEIMNYDYSALEEMVFEVLNDPDKPRGEYTFYSGENNNEIEVLIFI